MFLTVLFILDTNLNNLYDHSESGITNYNVTDYHKITNWDELLLHGYVSK